MDKVELLAKMENVLEIPTEQRLTKWHGDYGIYEPKRDVIQADIDKRIEELSLQIEHTSPITVEIRETLSRKITIENPQSIRKALDTVIEEYYKQNIILDAEDLQGVEFFPLDDMDFEMEM